MRSWVRDLPHGPLQNTKALVLSVREKEGEEVPTKGSVLCVLEAEVGKGWLVDGGYL